MDQCAFSRLGNADAATLVVVARDGRVAPVGYLGLATLTRLLTWRLAARNLACLVGAFIAPKFRPILNLPML